MCAIFLLLVRGDWKRGIELVQFQEQTIKSIDDIYMFNVKGKRNRSIRMRGIKRRTFVQL